MYKRDVSSTVSIVISILVFILAGCAGNAIESVQPTGTPVPPVVTDTPLPTPTTKPEPTATLVPNDNFNDNAINNLMWTVGTDGVGPKIEETNSGLEIFLPATSTIGSNKSFSAGYFSKFHLVGDFDIEVEYQILKWPRNNGVSVGLVVLPGGTVERARWGGPEQGENYITNYFQTAPGEIFDIAGETRTKDLWGKLRLTRIGDEMTGYFFRSGEWVAVRRGKVDTAPVEVSLVVWSGDKNYISNSSSNDIQVTFDNFIVNQGDVIWP